MIKAATKIICPNPDCKETLGKTLEDIHFGMRLEERLFHFDPPIKTGERTICWNCGTGFCDYALHTENGWQAG